MSETTPQLYDGGEEGWERKLHVECGNVYLEGYTNIDTDGFHPYEKPDLVEANRTSIKDYYGRQPQSILGHERVALDCLGDMRNLPYSDADKIVCLGGFEHLTLSDANKAILDWWNTLKVGGIVILSVPDAPAVAELLRSEEYEVRDFALQHLLGDERCTYSLHHWAYTEENLRQLLTGYGFVDIERLENVHFYPAIVLRARKADPFVPGRAYQRLPELQGGWKILDVGPGSFPLASATHFLDKKRFPEVPEEAPVTIFDLNSGQKLPFGDDSFDFVYCSHVLEHLERPTAVLEELQRIGRRGYVEIPSVCTDFMFKHGQTHPKWACWGSGNVLIFLEKTEEQNKLFLDFERVFGGFFHSAVHGKHLTAVQRAIRFHFWENQHLLNISASWDKKKGDFPVEAIEIRPRG